MMLLIFLIGFQLFPNNSTDFTAYAVTDAGSVITCQATYITAVSLGMDRDGAAYLAPAAGLLGGIACHYLFRNHFSSPTEHSWASIGKGHGLIFNVGWTFAIYKITKEPEFRATLEVMGEKMEKEEIIEFE